MNIYRPLPAALTTDRLRLRRRRPSDAAGMRRLWQERDPRSRRLIDADGHPTVIEMADLILGQLVDDDRTGLGLLAIEPIGSSDLLGYCGLTVGVATEQEPELAFELFESAQGRGYATEAARAIVAAARDTGRERLWATVRDDNGPSLNVLRKLGFSDSGRRTEHPVHGTSLWMTLSLQ